MSKKINYKSLLKWGTLIFLITFPIFDTIFFYSRVTTLVRILIVLVILQTTLFLYKESRKKIWLLIVYYILCLLYLLLSYLHAQTFISLFPDNFNYSVIQELFTVLKLIMPITLLYSLFYQKLSKKDYFFVVKCWILIISGIIIITNIFKISYASYTSEFIKNNIFEWKKGLHYYNTASRGFFNYANQEAIILVMLLVLSVYNFIKSNFKSIIYIFLVSLSLIILGTRISTLGGLLVLICCLMLYFFFVIIKKEKIEKKIILAVMVIIAWCLILPITPCQNRTINLNDNTSSTKVEKNSEVENKEKKQPLINNQNEEKGLTDNEEKKYMQKYVDNHVNQSRLPDMFYKDFYSYENDPKFWFDFVKNTKEEDIHYRLIELSIAKRIVQINDNIIDMFFGISNVRIQNVVNIEMDFILHYYAFGIVGMLILLLLYPLSIAVCVIKSIKLFNYFNITILSCVFLFCFCSLLSGNSLNSLATIIPFSFICAFHFTDKT